MKRSGAGVWLAVLLLGCAAAPGLVQGKSPEDLAKSIALRWKPILGLSDEQTARFETVALEAEKKSAAAKTASNGDPARYRDAMKPILEERNAAVVKILTPGQMQKYDAAMESARKKAAGKAPAAAPTKAPG